MEAQRTEIIKHLKKGKSLTALQALQKFGCMRLAARIYELIEQDNNIVKDMVNINGKRVARYSLKFGE